MKTGRPRTKSPSDLSTSGATVGSSKLSTLGSLLKNSCEEVIPESGLHVNAEANRGNQGIEIFGGARTPLTALCSGGNHEIGE
jgi:hypothetical protein